LKREQKLWRRGSAAMVRTLLKAERRKAEMRGPKKVSTTG
jgi:hypothetical protein